MAAGEAFSREQRERLERAVDAAERQTGIRFWVRVGTLGSDPSLDAESTLANLLDGRHDSGVLLLVGPEERQLEIMISPTARRRISDQAAGLAVLTLTSSFSIGDLVGGILNGLRQLADSAGRDPQGTQGQIALSQTRTSGRSPVQDERVSHDETSDLDDDEGAADKVEQPALRDDPGLERGAREVPGSESAPGTVGAQR